MRSPSGDLLVGAGLLLFGFGAGTLSQGALLGVAACALGAAGALWGVRLRSREAARTLQFLRRLAEAVGKVGERSFTRPVAEGIAAEIDAVAAAAAARSDALVERHTDYLRALDVFEALLRALYAPALVVDAAGVVQRVNPAATEHFQITEEEAKGRPFLQVVRDDRIEDELLAALREGRESRFETDSFTAKGITRFSVRIYPVTAGGKGRCEGAVILLFDVTRMRHLEKVRSEFVANVSHELRTPITSIKGFIETLLEEEVPPETQERFLRILKQEADRLDSLLRDLLELSFLESDRSPLRRESTHLARLTANVLQALEPQASQKRIAIRVDIPRDLPQIPVNPAMIEQALINLVDNAIKYSPEGADVHIEARRVANDFVEVAVADNGPGIPSEHLSRIFERFYRVDKARSRSVGGTGLGLSIVRHIVERHGGSVRAESRLGKGSRFIVTLPLVTEEVSPASWDKRL